MIIVGALGWRALDVLNPQAVAMGLGMLMILLPILVTLLMAMSMRSPYERFGPDRPRRVDRPELPRPVVIENVVDTRALADQVRGTGYRVRERGGSVYLVHAGGNGLRGDVRRIADRSIQRAADDGRGAQWGK
jgi:hypothetical protein